MTFTTPPDRIITPDSDDSDDLMIFITSDLLSEFAHGRLGEDQKETIKSSILRSEHLLTHLFGVENQKPCPIFYGGIDLHETTSLFHFWLNNCQEQLLESHATFLDGFIQSALTTKIKGQSLYRVTERVGDVVSLWARSLGNNARVQKTLWPAVQMHFSHARSFAFFGKVIDIGKDGSTNLISLWAQDRENEHFKQLLSLFSSNNTSLDSGLFSLSFGDLIEPKEGETHTNLISLWAQDHEDDTLQKLLWRQSYLNDLTSREEAYQFITAPQINYHGEAISFIDLSNIDNAVGAVSRQKLNEIITVLTPQERYQLLCHILEVKPDSNAVLPPMRLSECREKSETPASNSSNLYLYRLANALLAAHKPMGMDYVKYTMVCLSLLGLVGAAGALLLLHFVAAMPIVSALLHPASLAAFAGGVLFGGVALGLCWLYEPRISSIGRINMSECPTLPLSRPREDSVSLKPPTPPGKIKRASKMHEKETPQTDQNNTSNEPN